MKGTMKSDNPHVTPLSKNKIKILKKIEIDTMKHPPLRLRDAKIVALFGIPAS